MARLNMYPRIGSSDPTLLRELGEHAQLINAMTDGRLAGTNNATTAAPTTGPHAQGDYVRNSAPSEAGGGRGEICRFGLGCRCWRNTWDLERVSRPNRQLTV
jgi:hypothetical protein